MKSTHLLILKTHRSLTKASPFFAPIKEVLTGGSRTTQAEQALAKASLLWDTCGNNPPLRWYCASLDTCLEIRTRDSDAVVENWFRTTTKVILSSTSHRRAGDSLQLQQEFVVGRLKGVKIMKTQVPPSKTYAEDKRQSEGPETLPLSQEETWSPPTPTAQRHKYNLSETLSDAHWGGEGTIGQQTVSMTNPCTVDSLLHTLHLAMQRRPGIQDDLSKNANLDSWMTLLLQVRRLSDHREWSQGEVTGRGHRERSQGEVTGSGHREWSQGVVTGSGHRERSQGVVTGRGHRERSQGEVTGSGHRERSQGEVTGRGHLGLRRTCQNAACPVA